MAVTERIHRLMRSRRGDAAIEFIMVAAMLLLTFAMLISALVYVVQVYNASYITRRVVRYIETTGFTSHVVSIRLCLLNHHNFSTKSTTKKYRFSPFF